MFQLHLAHKKDSKKNPPQTKLAEYLLTETKARQEKIFNNPIMVCALYLDPRFHVELVRSRDKCDLAKENLLKIWQKIQALSSNDAVQPQAVEQINTSNGSEFDEFDALEKRLLGEQQENNIRDNESITSPNNNDDIEMIIELYQPQPIPVKSSVVSYWEQMKDEQKELYQIASVVFSVPPTEVQIERDFSRLDCVFTKRRGNLCPSRLEDIFVIHLNPDLFEVVTQEDIAELYMQLEAEDIDETPSVAKKLKF